MFNADTINNFIKVEGVKVLHLKSCDSTNTLLKKLAEENEPDKTVLIADSQSAGRGRMGRSFFSPDGCGLYMSILLRPNFKPVAALEITTAAAVAVARVVKKYTSASVGIKWVNDIYVDMKKVCGILTESSINFDDNKLNYAILGIGINLYTSPTGFPDEIARIACSLFKETPDDQTKAKITGEIINEFFDVYKQIGENTLIEEYRRLSVIIGKNVDVITPNKTVSATVNRINDDYSLEVLTNSGETMIVNSGDVSIKVKKEVG